VSHSMMATKSHGHAAFHLHRTKT